MLTCVPREVQHSSDLPWHPHQAFTCVLRAHQVFNYSKLGTHDEVARAMVTIPSKHRQGDRPWEQRVAMQPVARAGKGALWGGEVFLRLRYAAPQVLHICHEYFMCNSPGRYFQRLVMYVKRTLKRVAHCTRRCSLQSALTHHCVPAGTRRAETNMARPTVSLKHSQSW